MDILPGLFEKCISRVWVSLVYRPGCCDFGFFVSRDMVRAITQAVSSILTSAYHCRILSRSDIEIVNKFLQWPTIPPSRDRHVFQGSLATRSPTTHKVRNHSLSTGSRPESVTPLAFSSALRNSHRMFRSRRRER